MELKKLVEALDAQIVKGDIVGAFEKFAADNCVTYSNTADKTHTKAQKLEVLGWFVQNIATANRIELIASKIGKNTTDSQFVFDFSDRQGNKLVYNEIIRRTWNAGKVVEELYLLDQTLDNNDVAPTEAKVPAAKPVAAKTQAAKPAKTAKTTEAPAATKVPAEKPLAAKKPAAKTAPKVAPAPAKTDDLVLIEGIGPKIAELLIAAGITSFAQLADTKPAAIKTILDAAGKKFQMHEPATWPKQAALARDGKKAELAKLQEKLKAGK